MKKFFSKALMVTLCLAMVFQLAACGGDNTGGKKDETPAGPQRVEGDPSLPFGGAVAQRIGRKAVGALVNTQAQYHRQHPLHRTGERTKIQLPYQILNVVQHTALQS